MSTKFEAILANHCSPALFGLKSANLINCRLSDCPSILDDVSKLNRDFEGRISFKVIKKVDNQILILVYQDKKLEKTVFDPLNQNYLISLGYPNTKCLDDYICHLSSKISDTSFPHEVGVFLNYDLNDIIEFSKKNKHCLYCGYWQVFSDIEKKKMIFDKYTRCKNLVTNLINKGYKLEALI